MSYIPSFGEDEDLHGTDTLEEGLQPQRTPGSMPVRTLSHESCTVLENTGEMFNMFRGKELL